MCRLECGAAGGSTRVALCILARNVRRIIDFYDSISTATAVVNWSAPLDIFFPRLFPWWKLARRNGPLRQPMIICLYTSQAGAFFSSFVRRSHQFDSPQQSNSVHSGNGTPKREKSRRDGKRTRTKELHVCGLSEQLVLCYFPSFFCFLPFILLIQVGRKYGRPRIAHWKMKYDGLEIGSLFCSTFF